MAGYMKTRSIVDEARRNARESQNKMSVADRKMLNMHIIDLTKGYSDAIPLGDINELLKTHGYILLQEDGTEWSGFLSGDQGRTTIAVGRKDPLPGDMWPEPPFYPEVENTVLVLTWYKMPSGRYEVVAHLS